MVSLLDEAARLLEQASYDALNVEGKADQYAMFTATWAVKHYRAEVNKRLVTAVHTGEERESFHFVESVVWSASFCISCTPSGPFQQLHSEYTNMTRESKRERAREYSFYVLLLLSNKLFIC